MYKKKSINAFYKVKNSSIVCHDQNLSQTIVPEFGNAQNDLMKRLCNVQQPEDSGLALHNVVLKLLRTCKTILLKSKSH